ncbi:MAG TPA: dihydropteroate synthase, partial [Jiangellaceae bacterium]|nr:dihydropteroate synthase [Jiangellaceae bacterium]
MTSQEPRPAPGRPHAVVPGLPEPGRCLVMGVVNVTPDSFSDGGRWFDADAAVAHGVELAEQGADIVDVG